MNVNFTSSARNPNRLFPDQAPVGRCVIFLLISFACLGGGLAWRASAGEPSSFQLRAAAAVDGAGVNAEHIIQTDATLAGLRLCDAPALGKAITLTRAQAAQLLAAAAPGLAVTNWAGAEVIRISRRTRSLNEADVLAMLTASLQRDVVKDRGELDLRFVRPWVAPVVPDETLSVRLLDLPGSGVASSLIVRFELRTERETVGVFQASLQAHVWREVWTARSTLKRGAAIVVSDITHERRDIVNIRETLADFAAGDPNLELAESVQPNGLLFARMVKPRTVIRRGQLVLARVEDGALAVALKVEALEDGALGQNIRVRNPVSRRDLSARVLNEQTVLVPL